METRFHLMCLNPSRFDLLEYLADRTARVLRAAQPQAEEILRQIGEDPGRAPAELEEFRVFVQGVGELSQVLAQLPAYSPKLLREPGLAAGCRHEFDAIASSILADGKDFRAMLAVDFESYRGDLRAAVEKAVRTVHEGMREAGVERQEVLRDARGYLSEVLANPDAMTDPMLWFYQGWLSWKRGLDPEAIRHAFFQACLGSSPRKDLLFWLSSRHLAYQQSSVGAFDAAYAAAGQALRVRPDQSTLLEFARYAARSGHRRESANALVRCLALGPLAALDVLADEEAAA